MEALIKDIFTFLLQHYALYLVVVMSITTALIMIILNFAKKPFKKLTLKIQVERTRKFVNRTFIFILSFGLSVGFWFLLNWIAPMYFEIDYIKIFLNGVMPIFTYAYGEGWITLDTAKNLLSETFNKTEDGTLTKEEIKDTVKDLNSVLNAEEELNKLLKK